MNGANDDIYKKIGESKKKFDELVQGEIKHIHKDIGTITSKINIVKRLEKALEHNADDMGFLLQYKHLFLEIDPKLEENFQILEAYRKRDRLSDEIAVASFQSIIESESFGMERKALRTYYDMRDMLIDQEQKLEKVLEGKISYETVDVLTKKFILDRKMSEKERREVLFYPFTLIRLSKEEVKEKELEVENLEEEKASKKEPNTKPVEKTERIVEKEYKDFVESKKDELANIYDLYSNIKSDNDLSSKYKSSVGAKISYEDLKSMYEGQGDDFKGFYIFAVIDRRKEIADLLKDESSSDSLIAQKIEEFKEYVSHIDENIPKTEKPPTSDEKQEIMGDVYFNTTSDNKIVGEETNEKDIVKFIQISPSFTENKKGQKVRKIRGIDEINKQLGRDIFYRKVSGVSIAYMKINIGEEQKQALFYLALSPKKKDEEIALAVKEATKGRIEQIKEEVSKIENCVSDAIQKQNALRENILRRVLK